MEKTNLGTVLDLDVDWDDIGSWKSVWKNSKRIKWEISKRENFIEKFKKLLFKK